MFAQERYKEQQQLMDNAINMGFSKMFDLVAVVIVNAHLLLRCMDLDTRDVKMMIFLM